MLAASMLTAANFCIKGTPVSAYSDRSNPDTRYVSCVTIARAESFIALRNPDVLHARLQRRSILFRKIETGQYLQEGALSLLLYNRQTGVYTS